MPTLHLLHKGQQTSSVDGSSSGSSSASSSSAEEAPPLRTMAVTASAKVSVPEAAMMGDTHTYSLIQSLKMISKHEWCLILACYLGYDQRHSLQKDMLHSVQAGVPLELVARRRNSNAARWQRSHQAGMLQVSERQPF